MIFNAASGSSGPVPVRPIGGGGPRNILHSIRIACLFVATKAIMAATKNSS